MAKLIINRPKNFLGMARKMKILLNGNEAGVLSNGQDLQIDVNSGTHELTCKIGIFARPTSFSFDIKDAETKSFNVGFRKDYALLLFFVSLTFGLSIGLSRDGSFSFRDSVIAYGIPVVLYIILSYKRAIFIKPMVS